MRFNIEWFNLSNSVYIYDCWWKRRRFFLLCICMCFSLLSMRRRKKSVCERRDGNARNRTSKKKL